MRSLTVFPFVSKFYTEHFALWQKVFQKTLVAYYEKNHEKHSDFTIECSNLSKILLSAGHKYLILSQR